MLLFVRQCFICVKIEALFRLVTDSSGLANESRVCELLRECIQIPRQLGEIAAFGGSNVEPSVKSCFEKVSTFLQFIAVLI